MASECYSLTDPKCGWSWHTYDIRKINFLGVSKRIPKVVLNAVNARIVALVVILIAPTEQIVTERGQCITDVLAKAICQLYGRRLLAR